VSLSNWCLRVSKNVIFSSLRFYTGHSVFEDETTMLSLKVGHKSPSGAVPLPRRRKILAASYPKSKNIQWDGFFLCT
jgi:hypothetical protein